MQPAHRCDASCTRRHPIGVANVRPSRRAPGSPLRPRPAPGAAHPAQGPVAFNAVNSSGQLDQQPCPVVAPISPVRWRSTRSTPCGLGHLPAAARSLCPRPDGVRRVELRHAAAICSASTIHQRCSRITVPSRPSATPIMSFPQAPRGASISSASCGPETAPSGPAQPTGDRRALDATFVLACGTLPAHGRRQHHLLRGVSPQAPRCRLRGRADRRAVQEGPA